MASRKLLLVQTHLTSAPQLEGKPLLAQSCCEGALADGDTVHAWVHAGSCWRRETYGALGELADALSSGDRHESSEGDDRELHGGGSRRPSGQRISVLAY